MSAQEYSKQLQWLCRFLVRAVLLTHRWIHWNLAENCPLICSLGTRMYLYK